MFSEDVKHYDIKLELAYCSNGCVYMARYVPNNQHVVIKKYNLDMISKEDVEQIRDDILTMRQFSHPNLHTFHVAFVYGNELCLVTPLMCFGSCRDAIRTSFNTGFPEIFISLIIRDILYGLEYLHRRGYVHRSIRATHILLSQTKAVLSGFRDCTSFLSHGGRVTALHQLPPHSLKSLNWLAPEVLEQNLNGYTEKSDIYSIGLTCCELANGIEPYANTQPTFMLTEKARGNIPTILDCSTCPAINEMTIDTPTIAAATISAAAATTTSNVKSLYNHNLSVEAQQVYLKRLFSDEFHQFFEICMKKRASSRWSATKLLTHSFFKQCRHSNILDVMQHIDMVTMGYKELKDESLQLQEKIRELHVVSDNNADNSWSWEF